MTSAYKICDRDHFELCLHFELYLYPFSVCLQAKCVCVEFLRPSQSNGVMSTAIYKLSMSRFVHKVHFDVDVRQHIDFTFFSRDNLEKKTSTQ